MAVISIPSSVAGVKIPGALISGPLGALFGTNKNAGILQYPADLATNPARAHSVEFTIFDTQPINIAEKTQKLIEGGINGFANSVSTITTGSLQPPQDKVTSTVVLYMPETLTMDYNALYDSFSLTESMGKLGKVAQITRSIYENTKDSGSFTDFLKNAFGSGTGSAAALDIAGKASDHIYFGTKDASDVLLRAGGYAINPQTQLLYKGIDLRTFQLEFVMTPKTKDEAVSISKIVDTFMLAFLPRVGDAASAGSGQYFVMPSKFNIKFRQI